MKQNLKQSFGTTIRQLRENTGMAQENFAYEYGIARTYMGNIERGLANPSLDIIQTLANALQISVANLFATHPQPSDTPMQTQNLRQNFGLRTRFLRESLGLSQEVFARRWGVDRTYISKLDRGLANPSLDAIETLAQALEVSVEELFVGL